VTVMRNTWRAAATVTKDVVQQHARTDVEALDDGFRQWVKKAHGLDEVRGNALQQQPTLDERLPHKSKVELFEVADAAVHELRRAARRAASPVARLHHSDA